MPARRKTELSLAAIRKRAQRAHPVLTECEYCGATENLQRHHPDYSKPEEIIVLCQACHTAEDQRLERWGPGNKKPKTCVICGREFTNYSHVRVKTCSRECLSEAGRRNAAKREYHGNRYTKSIPNRTVPATARWGTQSPSTSLSGSAGESWSTRTGESDE